MVTMVSMAPMVTVWNKTINRLRIHKGVSIVEKGSRGVAVLENQGSRFWVHYKYNCFFKCERCAKFACISRLWKNKDTVIIVTMCNPHGLHCKPCGLHIVTIITYLRYLSNLLLFPWRKLIMVDLSGSPSRLVLSKTLFTDLATSGSCESDNLN